MMNRNIYTPVFIFTAATALLYILANNLPFGIGSYRFIWGPLSMAIIIITYPGILLKTPIKQLSLFGLFVVGILQYTLWADMDDWNRNNILDDFYSVFSIALIYFYLHYKNDSQSLSRIGKWSFFFLIVSMITTNIVITINPMIIRDSAGHEFGGINKTVFDRIGSGGYSFMHLLVSLIPILIFNIKEKKNAIMGRNYLILIFILVIITQIRGQVFANILVTFVISAFAFVNVKNRTKSLILLIAFSLIFLSFPISNIFRLSANQIGLVFGNDSDIYYKFNDFADFIENPELNESTGTGGRAERYPILWNAFIHAPLLGDASYNSPFDIVLGGHLYWMNRLTLWGIFGFLLYVFVLYVLFKTVYLSFDKKFRHYYLLAIISFIALGLMKQITGREPWLVMLIIIPGLYHWQKQNEAKRKIVETV